VKAVGKSVWGIHHILKRHAAAAIEMRELLILHHFRTLAIGWPVVFTEAKVERRMLVPCIFSGFSSSATTPHKVEKDSCNAKWNAEVCVNIVAYVKARRYNSRDAEGNNEIGVSSIAICRKLTLLRRTRACRLCLDRGSEVRDSSHKCSSSFDHTL
jgi:hypothetical protein